MNILFVDDLPEFKVQKAIEHLKLQGVQFSYEIVKSVNSAVRYLVNHKDEIDLAVVDLGLPWFDEGDEFDKLNGLVVVAQILRYKVTIPVIINSTTEIQEEEDFLERYTNKNAVVKHVQSLDGEWLIEFLKQL